MTPANFAREIVVPTLEDFRADRTSRRWAYLSAIAVYHLRDYLAEALATERGGANGHPVTSDDVRAAAREVDTALRAALLSPESFEVVRGVANGSKHGATRQHHVVPFTAGMDWERPPSVAGRMMAGISVCGDFTGGREIPHGDARFDVYGAVQTVFAAFVTAFPAHLCGCSFDPYPPSR